MSSMGQVARRALAGVWSVLVLGEGVNVRQMAGIAIVIIGLLCFVLLKQRGARSQPSA